MSTNNGIYRHVWSEHQELMEYIKLFSRKIKLAKDEWLDQGGVRTLNKLIRNIPKVEGIVVSQERIALEIIKENRAETASVKDILPHEAEDEANLTSIEKQEEVICKNINWNLGELLKSLRNQLECFDEDRKDLNREKEQSGSAEKERIALRPVLLGFIRDEKRHLKELDYLIKELVKEVKGQNFVQIEEDKERLPRFKVKPRKENEYEYYRNSIFGNRLNRIVFLVTPHIDSCFIRYGSYNKGLNWFKTRAQSNSWNEVKSIKLGEALFAKQGIILCLSKRKFRKVAVIATNRIKILEAI